MFCYKVGDDIHLKILELSDAQDMFALTDKNRTYLREWMPWVDSTATVDDTTAFIQSTLQQFASNQGFQAGILYKQQLVGAVGLHGINWSNRSSSVGYWLGEEFQGNGIMTEACKAAVDLAFREYGLNRVEIRAAVQNHKSRAIPERLGFQQEGISRQAEWLYDHYVDHVIYGMLAADWSVSVADHTTCSRPERRGYLHHVEVNVSNLERSAEFWGWLLEYLGYQPYQKWSDGRSWKTGDTYLVFVQTMQIYLDAGYHRKRTGLNHLAFHAESREQVDELTQLLRARGVQILYESSHPFAGGPEHYAAFFEDPDRIKVEIVAPD